MWPTKQNKYSLDTIDLPGPSLLYVFPGRLEQIDTIKLYFMMLLI